MGSEMLDIKMVMGSIAFLTPIPVKGDVEKLRRNLWIFPYTAILIGLIISIPSTIWHYFTIDIRFLTIVFYLIAEGINHVDGLADFGDALFAPENRKKEALKDTVTGTGGIVTVLIYLIIAYHTLFSASVIQIIFSQTVAKYSMLLLMATSRPGWQGMASYMMEFVGSRDLIIGILPIVVVGYFVGVGAISTLLFAVLFVFILKKYSESKFGGINGDIIGTVNCITFISTLSILTF